MTTTSTKAKRLASLLIAGLFIGSLAKADFLPRPPANPNAGVDGVATQHGDTASSDTTPLAGPGQYSNLNHKFRNFLAACPSILMRSDGHPMALCTAFLGRNPVVRILNKDTGFKMAKLQLPAGALLGGVYSYMDKQDRMVMVDGNNNIVRIKAKLSGWWIFKSWSLSIDQSTSIDAAVTGHCGGGDCDGVVSLSPDQNSDAIWFATKKGIVGIHDVASNTTQTVALPAGEEIHNSFSTTTGSRAAIVTDHALYLLQKNGYAPQVVWRKAYDRGPVRKPGQLSHGSGATPTFFGPATGTEYIAITDNATQMSVLVYDASTSANGGDLICQNPMFAAGASGSENSVIASNRSIIVASTYGYPYPAEPEGVPTAQPSSAPFVGGMARLDVRSDESGCDVVWENNVRSSAVPKLSTADNLIYTIERKDANGDNSTSIFDSYHFTIIDPFTGSVVRQKNLGAIIFRDTLEMAGNADQNGVFWQGALGGVHRIE